MIILGYVGDHKKDGLAARIGWALVRLAQTRARFKRVTHVEAVLSGDYTNCTIASSSLRDGGVRIKTTPINHEHWIAISVPVWDAAMSQKWFEDHLGMPYDWLGAVASVLWFLPERKASWFCNEAIGASVGLIDPNRFPPCDFMTLALSQPGARDVTADLFCMEP